MKTIRCVSIVLCLVFFINLFSPMVFASEHDVLPEVHITTIEDYANCYYQSDAYTANALIDLNTGDGCFSILYGNDSEYVYEFYFTIPISEIHTASSAFWNSLFSLCISSQSQWHELYIPNICYLTTSENTRSANASDITEKFAPALEAQLNITECTDRIIHTDSRNRYIFHIHESVEFAAVKRDLYFIPNTLSVSSFIATILQKPLTATLLSVFSFAFGLTIPAQTEIGSHSVGVLIQRYVKRMDSDIWLNMTYCNISYDGYAIEKLDYYAIDPGSESMIYSHSEEYFNDKTAQIDDGYYYLTHN